MRGGAVIPPNFNPNFITKNDNNENNFPNPPEENEEQNMSILNDLGFEEGELEMFFDTYPNINQNQIIEKYLEIARAEPFNQSWQNENDAATAEYELNAIKSNGVAYTKHDIVSDVFDSFYNGGKKRRRNKSRKNKKSKKGKKHSTRKRRRQRK